MSPVSLLGLLLVVFQGGADSPAGPRAAVRMAVDAIESDSVLVWQDRLEARLQQRPRDRAARLMLATLARLTYDYDRADRLYRELLESGSADQFTIYARIGLAEADRVHRSLDSAAVGFERAAGEAEALRDRSAQVEAWVGFARSVARLAPIDSALVILGRAQRLLSPDDRELESVLRCTRAPLLVAAGKPGAKADADRGLVLAHRAGDLRLQGLCWQALGSYLFINVDDPAVSAPPFDSAEAHQRKARDLAGLAETLAWSGYDHFSFFDHGPAQADLTLAIALARRSRNRFAEAWALRLKGSIGWRTGAFPNAARDLHTAANLARDLGDRPELLNARRMLGNVAFGQGRVSEAESAFREALPVAERLGDAVTELTILHGLAWVSAARGDWADAERQYALLIEFMRRRGLQGLIPGLQYSGAVIALRTGALDRAEGVFRAYLRTSSPSEYIGRYQSRSRLAEIQVRRGRLDSAVVELTRASDHLDSLRAALPDDQLKTLTFQTGGGKFEEPDYGFATLIAAFVAGGRVEVAMRLAERRRARDLADRLLRAGGASGDSRWIQAGRRGVTADSIPVLEASDDSTAVVEYIAGRWGQPTTVLVLVGRQVAGYVLPSLDSTGPKVERFLGLVQNGEPAPALGDALRRSLLDPVLAQLPGGIRRLVIVPDDVLHRLPFDLLPLEDGRPLISRYAVALAPSAAVAMTLRRREPRSTPGSMLVMGNPDFARPVGVGAAESAEYQAGFDQTGGLLPLPYAGVEARSVGRFSRGAVVRLGGAASERFLKDYRLGDVAILHFATHALVDDQAVNRTALALAAGQGEDGFLSPAEILALDLDADLIVLSACRTAGGPVVSGEGVRGLTAPLIAAGARAVVATHWPIRDRASLRLVRRFYAALAGGEPVSEALRTAKLEAIRRGAPARDWAAFTMVGDPLVRVLLPEPSPARKMVPALAGLVVLVVGLAWVRRRRQRFSSVPDS